MDPSSLGSLVQSQSNVQLDQTKAVTKTNDYGIAYFNLLILQGINGNYKLSFSAQGASPKSTSAFQLVNPINNVYFLQNISQTIEVTQI